MILIAYDGSKQGRDAIVAAARFLSGPAIVLHVQTSSARPPLATDAAMGAMIDQEDWGDRARRVRRRGDEVAEEGARVATTAGLPAEPLVVEEDAHHIWRAIIDVAEKRDAKLIVLGHRSRSGIHGSLPGSVSRCVVARSSRPVVVVPAPRGDREAQPHHYTSDAALQAFSEVAEATRRDHHDTAERRARQAAARRAETNPRRGVPGAG
jgi:nucleotide-binding universal stress UspA family protein